MNRLPAPRFSFNLGYKHQKCEKMLGQLAYLNNVTFIFYLDKFLYHFAADLDYLFISYSLSLTNLSKTCQTGSTYELILLL